MNIDEVFIPKKGDCQLSPKSLIQSTDPKSGDPYVYIVIFHPLLPRKYITNEFADTGTVNPFLYTSLSSSSFANGIGLPYRPPTPDALLKSSGHCWDYQASPELTKVLRSSIKEQFRHCESGFLDKLTIPHYLFISGAGTGKSRNAAERHKTALKCFNGTYFKEKDEKLASQLRNPFVFHVSLENGTGLQAFEDNPWRAIGMRILFQILLQEATSSGLSLEDVYSKWHAPTPREVIRLLQPGDSSTLEKRTIFLVVDGFHKIYERFGGFATIATFNLLIGWANWLIVLVS